MFQHHKIDIINLTRWYSSNSSHLVYTLRWVIWCPASQSVLHSLSLRAPTPSRLFRGLIIRTSFAISDVQQMWYSRSLVPKWNPELIYSKFWRNPQSSWEILQIIHKLAKMKLFKRNLLRKEISQKTIKYQYKLQFSLLAYPLAPI